MNIYGTSSERINQFFSKFHFKLLNHQQFTLTKPKDKKDNPIFKSNSQQIQFNIFHFKDQKEKQYINLSHINGNKDENQDSLQIITNNIDFSSETENILSFKVDTYDSRGHLYFNQEKDSAGNKILFSVESEKESRIEKDNFLKENKEDKDKQVLTLIGKDPNKKIADISKEEISKQYKEITNSIKNNETSINQTLAPPSDISTDQNLSTLSKEGKDYIEGKSAGFFYPLKTKYQIINDQILVLDFENTDIKENPSISLWENLPNIPTPSLEGYVVYGRIPKPENHLLEFGLRDIHGLKANLNFYCRLYQNENLIDFEKNGNNEIIYQEDKNGKKIEGALLGKTNSQNILELFFDKNYFKK